jgi:hypothetical protein
MWLGTAGSKRFSPGSKPAVLKVDGWRLGWPSARTLVFLSTPPIPPPSGSTPTWPPPQSSQPTQPSKMPAPVASPPTTIYGSRWPASLGQPAALPRPPASAASGPAKATFWLGQGPRPATSHARRSTDHQSQPSADTKDERHLPGLNSSGSPGCYTGPHRFLIRHEPLVRSTKCPFAPSGG